MSAQMRKPFNPILGETYQATIGQYRVYMEQVQHHPPVTRYHVQGQDLQVHGSLEYRPFIGPNTAGGVGHGAMVIEFSDGHKVEIWAPQAEVSGLLYGERAYNITGKMTVFDRANGLQCEIRFQPQKKSGLKGLVSGWGATLLGGEQQKADYFEGEISREKGTEVCKLQGHWTEDCWIDGQLYWHIDDFRGFKIKPTEPLLPSDCRFREDLIALKDGHEDLAQVSLLGF